MKTNLFIAFVIGCGVGAFSATKMAYRKSVVQTVTVYKTPARKQMHYDSAEKIGERIEKQDTVVQAEFKKMERELGDTCEREGKK